MANFTVGGKTYAAAPLNVFKQFHVARKLGAAAVDSLAGIMRQIDKAGGIEALLAAPTAEALPLISELVAAIGRLSDEDANFVINECLGSVQRQDAQLWAPITVAHGTMQFSDIDLASMMQIIWHVLQVNYGSFFSGLASSFQAQQTEAPK